MTERAFAFLELNERPAKPRSRGVTEIRGPYYAPVGRRYLADLLETMGAYVDTLKYAGGSFALMPRETVRALNELCHEHEVAVSTGGFLENVLGQRGDAVARYLDECRELGFDIVEISSGFVTFPIDDLVRLTNGGRRGRTESRSRRSGSSSAPAAPRPSRHSKPRGRATSARRSSSPSATSTPARR